MSRWRSEPWLPRWAPDAAWADALSEADPMDEPRTRSVTVSCVAGYEPLLRVLVDALDQAQSGKGLERHARAERRPVGFLDQRIMRSVRVFGPGAALAQVAKKVEEATGLPAKAAQAELLGAIVYAAAAYIGFERGASPEERVLPGWDTVTVPEADRPTIKVTPPVGDTEK